MFNEVSCNTAVSIASSLQSRHTKIKPTSSEMGSIIEQIVFPITQNNVQWDSTQLGELIRSMSLQHTSNEDVVADHQDVRESYASQMSRTLITNVNLVRKVAIPLIEETFENAKIALEQLRTDSMKVLDICMNYCGEFELIDDAAFSDMVMRYGNSNFQDAINSARVCSDLTEDQLFELIKTGSPEFDERVSRMIGSSVIHEAGQATLSSVWQRHFVQPEDSKIMYTPNNVVSRGSEFLEWVIAFLLANGLMTKEVPEGVSVSLESLQSIMNRYRAYCGYNVQRIVKNYTARRSTGMVVLDEYTDREGVTCMQLISSNADKAREAGVSTEALIGYKLRGGVSWFIDTLIKENELNLKAYTDAVTRRQASLVHEGRTVVKDSIVQTLRTRAQEGFVVDDAGTRASISPDPTQLHEEINKALGEIEGDIFEPAQCLQMIQSVISRTALAGTMGPLIIERMSLFARHNYDNVGDIRYAALMAVVSICVDSLVSQFEIGLTAN